MANIGVGNEWGPCIYPDSTHRQGYWTGSFTNMWQQKTIPICKTYSTVLVDWIPESA